MTWDQIKSNWMPVCGRIMETWGKLSEDDLVAIAGDRQHLIALLQLRYGYGRVQAETKVDAFAQQLFPMPGGAITTGEIRH